MNYAKKYLKYGSAAEQEKFNKLVHVPFNVENSGTQIIFHDKQTRYFEEEELRYKNKVSSFTELKNL